MLRRLIMMSALFAQTAVASAADFYAGKVITIIVGAPAGAIYDLSARVFGRHLADHIPGHPSIIIQNMPGAAGLRAANWLYNVAPRDGTVLGLSLDNILLNPFLTPSETKYRSDRFQWIGIADRPSRVLYAWGASNVRSIEDAKQREVLTGITAPGTSTHLYPSLANAFIGTHFKKVSGYEGAGGLNIALERGEIEAVGANSWSNIKSTKPDWIEQGKIRPLFQVTTSRDEDMPNVPTLLELVTSEKGRRVVEMVTRSEIGFFLAAPPDTPADRVSDLRKAFKAMLETTAYRADATSINLGSHAILGEDLQRIATQITQTSADTAAAFVQAVTEKE